MYFYHGNKQYYLAEILLHDQELETFMYDNGFVGNYDRFANAIAEAIYPDVNKILGYNMTMNELYDMAAKTKTSDILSKIQNVLSEVYGRTLIWYYVGSKPLYVNILKTIIYGSIKHFFFINRDKYLPQYDWYLINSNAKRKTIVDILFKEFDKLTNVFDAIRLYQDIDEIPLEFMTYLQEITGLTVNTYSLFTELQLRSLTKHLIEIWREKGELFSIELMFACMGINCTTQELWFDKRLYYNPENFNNFTKAKSKETFGYYLTPRIPYLTTYDYSLNKVNLGDCTAPKSSRIWEHTLSKYSSEERIAIIQQLLETDYTYFKSNFILLNFNHIENSNAITKEELAIYKELLNRIIPVFIRTYYGNEYADTFGNEDWDILKSVDLGSRDYSTTVRDNIDNRDRPADLFTIFDTDNKDAVPERLAIPGSSVFIGKGFVSGSCIKVNKEGENDELFDAEFDPDKEIDFASIFFIQNEDPFDPELETQKDDSNLNTFEPSGGECRNLFEISNWTNINRNVFNDLYDGDVFNGEIQYEYLDSANPIKYMNYHLNKALEITLE